MSEPKRLVESNSPASRLLLAGLRDNPKTRAARRVAVALGLGAASASSATGASALGAGAASSAVGVTGAAAGTGAASASVGLVGLGTKWVVVGLVGGTLAAGGAASIASLQSTAPSQSAAVVSPQSERAKPTESAKPRALPPERDTHAPAVVVDHGVESSIPRPAPAPVRPESAGSRPNAARRDTGRLGRDLSHIDATRRALKAGDAKQAEALLDGYTRKRETDFFEREALVLRIEALVQQGQHERAASLASDYFRRFPQDVHGPRIRGLLGSRTPDANAE